LLSKLFTQSGCSAHGQLGTWKLPEHGITEEFHDSPVIPTDYLARECLKNFDLPKGTAFIFRCPRAVSGDIGKPQGNECSLHWELGHLELSMTAVGGAIER
jgi:hypothetical protein